MRRFTFEVIVPAGALLVIWTGSIAVGLHGGIPHWLRALPAGQRAMDESAIMAGTAMIIAVFWGYLAFRFARRIAREAGYLAETAIADIHDSAAAAAAAEAGLRDGLRQVLVSLGRRHQSLVHRQLRIIDRLEQQTNSSSELAELFTLDHLTTRMRRHAESLTVLAGEAPGRAMSGPVPVVDVMRAAAAEVEDYKRVVVRSDAREAIAAPAVTDLIHLLAELIENATLYSPSTTKVEVRAGSVANGFVIEVEDRGLGMPPEQLAMLNERLSDPPDIDLADADRLGLFVAGKLAARHGAGVSLTPSAYRGTKAIVILPRDIIRASELEDSLPGVARHTGGQSGRLNLRAPGVLKLASGDSQDGPGFPESTDAQSAKGPQPRDSAGTLAGPDWELPVRRPRQKQAPAGTSAFDAGDSGQPTAGRPPLPRRVSPSASGRTGRAGRSADNDFDFQKRQAPDSPLPEAARSLAASVQLSWRMGRDGDDPPTAGENEEAP